MDARLLEQCAYEVRAADRLRQSNRASRAALYSEVYTGYAEAFPEHLSDSESKRQSVRYELLFVKKFLRSGDTVAEIGPGRCMLAFAMSPLVKRVIGIDVSAAHVPDDAPANFTLMIGDGMSLPLPDNSADIVVSAELIEHLHPDDASDQVREVFRILRDGGSFICGTPNIVCGPHDCGNVSPALPCRVENGLYVTNGLHLREYSNRVLAQMLRDTGFAKITPYIGFRGHYCPVPLPVMTALEDLCKLIPLRVRSRSRILRALLGVRLRAVKRWPSDL